MIKLLPLLFTIQVSSGATVYFSYLGMANRPDALGNPVGFLVGGYEPGHLTFHGNPSSLNAIDISDFSFTATLPDTDSLGNPVARIVEFNDLLLFNANSAGGSFTDFTLVSESTFRTPSGPFDLSSWADGQVFRFSVMPDLSARLEAVSPSSTITVTEGIVALVPEPGIFALASIGMVLLGVRRRRPSPSAPTADA